MEESGPEARVRYPLHALLLVGITWAFYSVVLLALALFMLPIVPLAPAFVMIMVSMGGLLGSVHEYARSVATPAHRGRLRSPNDGKVAQAAQRAPQTS